MTEASVMVYGAHWCPDCRRAKQFLGEHFVPYQWVDIEQDKDAERLVLEKNGGRRIIPTIVFGDGSFLVEPSNAALAQKLGMTSEARREYYDLIVVGGGPAGLTASIYAAREGLQTLVVERSGLGGQASLTVGIDNFPGFPDGISGLEFTERVVRQARRFGVEILQAVDVAGLGMEENYHCVVMGDGRHYHSQAVLITTGASYKRLGVPGEDDFIGAGVHFCATCDGPFYKGAEQIVVVGGGNSACEEGLHLTNFAQRVTLLVRGSALQASRIVTDKVLEPGSRVDVRLMTAVEAFEGERGKLTTVRVRDLGTHHVQELHPAAAFIFIGQQPNSGFARGFVQTDDHGFILTGHDLAHARASGAPEPFAFETSRPGVFAAGDVRHGSVNQVASAVGEGAGVAIAVHEYLRTV